MSTRLSPEVLSAGWGAPALHQLIVCSEPMLGVQIRDVDWGSGEHRLLTGAMGVLQPPSGKGLEQCGVSHLGNS